MRKWILCVAAWAVCLMMSTAVFAQGQEGKIYKDRFVSIDGRKYYYDSTGKRAAYTGWKTIKGRKYYFHRKHYIVVRPGWQKIGGKKYYFGPKGSMYSDRWATLKGKRYYFKKNGVMATRWARYKGKYYYFKETGEVDRNTIGRYGKDYYLVNENGMRCANILKGVGIKAGMSKSKKLQVCFDYVIKNFGYLPAEVWPPKGWEPYHAYRIMISRYGNCYDYAAAFCYMARAVGYKDMICVAGERSDETGGYRPHGWCECNGRVYDPRLTYPGGQHPYGTAYGDLPYRYRK